MDYAEFLISKDVKEYLENPLNFPIENKRDTVPFSGQLPCVTVPKQYNFRGTRPDIALSTNTKGSNICFNTESAKTPFYLRHFRPFPNDQSFVGDVTKDPRYGVITNNFSNKYAHL
jgi:hypothetical protein